MSAEGLYGFEAYTSDELLGRDKVNLNITWLRDESLEKANK